MENIPTDIDYISLEQLERGSEEPKVETSDAEIRNVRPENEQVIKNNIPNEDELLRLNRALISLQSASSAIASCLDLEQVISTYTWELADLLAAEGCIVFEWDSKIDSLSILGTYPIEAAGQFQSLTDFNVDHVSKPNSHRFLYRVIEERSPQQIKFDMVSSDPWAVEVFQLLDARLLLLLPLVFQDRVVGLVTIGAGNSYSAFSDQEISIAQLLTDQAVGSIVNAQLYKKLIEANHRLEKNNDELDAYAHTVAHNLKDPLANLLGFAYLMRDDFNDMAPQDIRKFLNFIIESGVRITETIDGLLLLASIRNEDMQFEPISMDTIVSVVLQSLSTTIDERRAIITVSAAWPQAWGYANWIEQIWLNFISNALKYGGDPPLIELGADIQANGVVRFWVRDNGIGLSVEQQELLFKPFAKLSPSSIEGHGLGLSIVERMVCKMGGRVGVESLENEGSLFYFTLPADNPDENEFPK